MLGEKNIESNSLGWSRESVPVKTKEGLTRKTGERAGRSQKGTPEISHAGRRKQEIDEHGGNGRGQFIVLQKGSFIS